MPFGQLVHPAAVQLRIAAPRGDDSLPRGAVGHIGNIALCIVVLQRKDVVGRQLGRDIVPRLAERPLCAVAKTDPVHRVYLPAVYCSASSATQSKKLSSPIVLSFQNIA